MEMPLTEADLECLEVTNPPKWIPKPDPNDPMFNPKTGEYEW